MNVEHPDQGVIVFLVDVVQKRLSHRWLQLLQTGRTVPTLRGGRNRRERLDPLEECEAGGGDVLAGDHRLRREPWHSLFRARVVRVSSVATVPFSDEKKAP
jgi:hypothetical protein